MDESRVGAFFDMDKTLIAENSASLYMRWRYERGEISASELASGLAAYLRYKVGFLDLRAWTQTMVSGLGGLAIDEVRDELAEWFAERVVPAIYPEAREIVERHSADGHVVAIVSGSMRFVVEPLAEHLGIEHILYTRIEERDGCLTGRVIDPICFEHGKIYWLQQLVEEERIDLARSWFYTDSVTDLPLLELVGHPIVTNPDPRLYRVAARRRWPVRFFEEPGPAGRVEQGGAAPPSPGASRPSP